MHFSAFVYSYDLAL